MKKVIIKTLADFQQHIPGYLKIMALLSVSAAAIGWLLGAEIKDGAIFALSVLGTLFIYEDMNSKKAAAIAYCKYLEGLGDAELLEAYDVNELPPFERRKVEIALAERVRAREVKCLSIPSSGGSH